MDSPLRGSSEDQAESFLAEPGNDDRGFVEAGRKKQWIVGSLLKPDLEFLLRDRDLGRGIDEVAKQVTRFCGLVAITDL